MIWQQKKSEWTCCCALSHLLGKMPLFAQDVWDGCLSIKPSRISNIGMFQHKSVGSLSAHLYRRPAISTCRDASEFECPPKKKMSSCRGGHAYPKDVGSRVFFKAPQWVIAGTVPQELLRSKTASWLMAWKILVSPFKKKISNVQHVN